MLAQSFLSASDLGITAPQKDALMKVLVLLETGKLEYVPDYIERSYGSKEFTGHFNMDEWACKTGCGTIRCIGGTAAAISGNHDLFGDWSLMGPQSLRQLFAPPNPFEWSAISPSQAAIALRSYLTTGDARWDLATAGSV